MWDLENDWSDDDTFGLDDLRSRKDPRQKQRIAPTAVVDKSAVFGLSDIKKGKIDYVDVGLSNIGASNGGFSRSTHLNLDEYLTYDRENSHGNYNKKKKIGHCEKTRFESSDADSGSRENRDAVTLVNKGSCSVGNPETGISNTEMSLLDFEDHYMTFGLNSLKLPQTGRNKREARGMNGCELKRRSDKLLVDLVQELRNSPDDHASDKEIFKFRGVYDSSKTFFIRSFDSSMLKQEIEMRLDPGSFSIYARGMKKWSEHAPCGNSVEDSRLGAGFRESESSRSSRRPMRKEMLTRKYAPKSCLDLVNDEGTIRSILRWIKQWDRYVFGIDGGKTKRQCRDDVSGNANGDEERQPPLIPVLLIGGPSGSGKTCIVNVLAKQCGYEVSQIKVADEKVIDNFENSIKMGINYSKIGSSIQSNDRPSLILVDELDAIATSFGSAGNSVSRKGDRLEFLTKLVENHAKTRDVISRPIICICNDIHNKSLRSLKSKVTTIVVNRPPENALFKRLQRICKLENIAFESEEILSEIISIHNGDIRSCLNSIQIMCQKEPEEGEREKELETAVSAGAVRIYWEDLENCCYTKDAEQDASLFIRLCFGLGNKDALCNQSGRTRNDDECDRTAANVSFMNILDLGDETLLNFGQSLVGLLTENVYRCNLLNDFYFDYIRVITDSVSEYSIISSKVNTLVPFLQASLLISKKIAGLHCNQFRHLGLSTYSYSQQVSVQNSNIYRNISESVIEPLRSDTLTLAFKTYTLPSMMTHFNDTSYLKHLSVWKSPSSIPKLKGLISNKPDNVMDKEELSSLTLLKSLISKMVCYGFKFSTQEQNGPKYNSWNENLKSKDSKTPPVCGDNRLEIEPDIFSLYSLRCLNNSVNNGYIKNPVIGPLKLDSFIYDKGYYTLINMLVEHFKDEISCRVTNSSYRENRNDTKSRAPGEGGEETLRSISNDINRSSSKSKITPTFDELLARIGEQTGCESSFSINTEEKRFHCIYVYNDGFINAIKMDAKLSDLLV